MGKMVDAVPQNADRMKVSKHQKKQMYLIHLVSGPGDARNAPQTEVHHLHNLQRNWEE